MLRTGVGARWIGPALAVPLAGILLSSCGAHRSTHLTEPGRTEEGRTDQDHLIAQRIRQAILADGLLSKAAHRVQVVVRDGQVTLSGPVRSETEARTVFDNAVEVVGNPRKVSNQLTLKY